MRVLIDSSMEKELLDIIDKHHKIITYNIDEMPLMPYDNSMHNVMAQWLYSKAVDNDVDLIIVKNILTKTKLNMYGIKAISLI